jgi:hypothetical protein
LANIPKIDNRRFQVSEFSVAAGRERPVKSKKETLKKQITNIEQGMSNIEVMYSVYFKETERSDSTLHHSKFLVRYSTWPELVAGCGSLFHIFVVSYKYSDDRELWRYILTPET